MAQEAVAARGRRDVLFAAAAVAAAAAALLAPVAWRGEGLLPAGLLWRYPPWTRVLPPGAGGALFSDQLLAFWPWRLFLRAQLASGHLPLWNPLIAGGVPFVGCAQAALFFPTELWLAWLPPAAWSLAAAFLKLFAAGFFASLHARRLGVGRSGAALAGISFALCGFMIAWLGHPQTNAACLLPALFWTLGRAFERESARAWAAAALVVGLILLGGHPPTALHVLGAGAAYALFLAARGPRSRRRRDLGAAALAALAGCGLAAPALLPYLEYLGLSSSAASAASLARWGTRLPWSLPLHLVLPLAAGTASLGHPVLDAAFGIGFSGNFLERAGWIGLPALAFAVHAVRRRWAEPEVRFHAALAAFGLAAALGIPPLPWLWRALPGLSAANPTRLLLLFGFGGATLAGLGLDAPARATDRRDAALFIGGALSMIAASAFVVAVVWGLLPPAARGFELGQAAAGVLEAACAAALVAFPGSRRWAPAVAALFLLRLAAGVNPSAPADRLYPPTPSLARLAEAAGSGRALALGDALPPDAGMALGLRDARGRDFTTLARYERLVRGAVGDFGFYGRADALPAQARLLAVSALAAPSGAPADAPAGWERVDDGDLQVFRAPQAAPRALFVAESLPVDSARALAAARDPRFDPARTVLLDDWFTPPTATRARGTARIARDEANEVVVEVESDGPGWLLLLDSWFPGWRVDVDGRLAPLRRADYAFRAVAVPAGRSTVRFSYEPYSFAAGLLLAAASALALAAAWRRG
jgi:hypothetical protein